MLNGRLVQNGEKFLYLEDTSVENNMYFYPIDLELRLISSLKIGDREQVKILLETIYENNFQKRYLSFDMGLQLIFSMRGTIYRVVEQTDVIASIRDRIKELDQIETIEGMFHYAVKINMAICNLMQNHQKKELGNLKFKLTRYLETCYMRPELNLYQVAIYFGVTETYTYQFFKEHIGVSFADYLENIRIQKACNLLSNPDIAVKTVAQMVGYSSDSTFRRAFKRIIGLAPTQYGIVMNSK